MARLGFLCPPDLGHLYPTASLAQALQRRGHEVVFLQIPDRVQWLENRGFSCRAYRHPFVAAGWLEFRGQHRATLSGYELGRWTLEHLVLPLTEVLLTEGQRLLSGAGCGGLVCDQKVAGAGSVAMALGLKHITLSSALLRYEHPWITTSVISYEDQFLRPSLHSWFAKRIERFFQRRAFRPVLERIHRYRSDHGLPQITNLNGEDSPHAHLLPQPRCFEPLAPDLPEHFHFAGPWTAPSIRPGDGDSWRDLERRLDGRPLVYATLGTLARDHELLRAVAAACATLPVQLLIAAGGDPSLLDGLEGDPIVVASAPQLEVLERASAVVCHGGLNTTLEALARGVPVVAIPRAYDQGGVAARIEWSGCGVAVPLRRANLRNLREALLRVLEDSAPRGAAQRAAQEMRQSGGVAAAAEIAERALVGP